MNPAVIHLPLSEPAFSIFVNFLYSNKHSLATKWMFKVSTVSQCGFWEFFLIGN